MRKVTFLQRICRWLALHWSVAAVLVVASAAEGPAEGKSGAVRHVDPAAASKLIQQEGWTVLDLRTPEEFQAGHVAEAKNVDFRAKDFAEQLAKLDRDGKFLIHCASGRRSTQALPVFEKLGFKHLAHLDGGLKAWEKDGQPVTSRQP